MHEKAHLNLGVEVLTVRLARGRGVLLVQLHAVSGADGRHRVRGVKGGRGNGEEILKPTSSYHHGIGLGQM
jgi:hypothetical protein